MDISWELTLAQRQSTDNFPKMVESCFIGCNASNLPKYHYRKFRSTTILFIFNKNIYLFNYEPANHQHSIICNVPLDTCSWNRSKTSLQKSWLLEVKFDTVIRYFASLQTKLGSFKHLWLLWPSNYSFCASIHLLRRRSHLWKLTSNSFSGILLNSYVTFC